MAASKSLFSRAKHYRFLPTEQKITNDSMAPFELDESEVWNSTARSQSPEYRKHSPRISKNTAATARGGVIGSASLPVNVPDWSKILKDEYRENGRRDSDDGDDYDSGGDRIIPPHEYLARSRIASLSVHEGIGRTLKGRDLSRVRNAIWQKTGFQD